MTWLVFSVLDPNGIKRKIPYQDLKRVMDAGAKFASKDEQAKAISLSQINKQFPDMPDWLKSGILSAQKTPVGNVANKAQPFSEVINDVGAMAKNAPGEVAHAIGSLPGQLLDSAMQIANNPLPDIKGMVNDPRHFYQHGGAFPRVAQSGLSGLLGTAKNVANLPSKTSKYLAEKGLLPKGIADFYQKFKIPEDTGLEKAILGEEQPGDVLFKQGIPAAFGGKAFAANPVKAGAAYAGLQGENPFTGALGAKAFEKIGKGGQQLANKVNEGTAVKAEAVENATNQHELADKELKQAQIEAGVDTPHALQKRIHSTKEALASLEKEAAELPSPEHYEKAKGLVRTHEQQIADAEAELNHRLGMGLTHNEHIAEAIYKPQMAIENAVKQEYQDINQALKEHDVPMQSNEDLRPLRKN